MKKLFGFKKSSETQIEESSLLGVLFIDALLIVISMIIALKGPKAISAIFLGLGLFGIFARIIASINHRNMTAKIDLDRSFVFPGDELKVEYQICNHKSIPVPFVEVGKKLKYPLILSPTSASEKPDNIKNGEEGKNEKENFFDRAFNLLYKKEEDTTEYDYLERCSLIPGRSEMTFSSSWKANHRGIENLRDMYFTAGDSFGLIKMVIDKEPSSRKEIVVYPRLQPVSTNEFTKNKWEGEVQNKGVLEDKTQIKLVRPYEETDSLKSVNYRLLARNQGMMTNKYEVISPKKVHFIFDGQSFMENIFHEKEFEDALSILASFALKLEENGMYTGISLPESKLDGAVNIFPGPDSIRLVLYKMAGYELKEKTFEALESGPGVRTILEKSKFKAGEILEEYYKLGKVYYITYSNIVEAESDDKEILTKSLAKVLTYEDLLKMKEGLK